MRLIESDVISTNVHLGAVSAELNDSRQHGSLVLGQMFSSAYEFESSTCSVLSLMTSEFSSTSISYSLISAVMSCSVLSSMERPIASSTLCMMRSHGIFGTSMSNDSPCRASLAVFSATNFLYWSLSINLRVKLEANSSTFYPIRFDANGFLL